GLRSATLWRRGLPRDLCEQRQTMAVRFGFSLQGRGALADRETITALARRAEALGYDSIWVTDRLLIPVESRSAYPYSATGAFPLGPDEPPRDVRGEVHADRRGGRSPAAPGPAAAHPDLDRRPQRGGAAPGRRRRGRLAPARPSAAGDPRSTGDGGEGGAPPGPRRSSRTGSGCDHDLVQGAAETGRLGG